MKNLIICSTFSCPTTPGRTEEHNRDGDRGIVKTKHVTTVMHTTSHTMEHDRGRRRRRISGNEGEGE